MNDREWERSFYAEDLDDRPSAVKVFWQDLAAAIALAAFIGGVLTLALGLIG